ncbi:uncharacterized protein [Lepeophtheirus salmonis]|uniref:Schwannomin interacting protein 1 C-terminal domain-containing protein n=1 Tax=Lepeophtheirus salmonis TaxID=72036 RepID=A0A0K2UM28_LEPSM|nr:uncharacterized protein LOC121123061 [Lepeophtheirus salmonis]
MADFKLGPIEDDESRPFSEEEDEEEEEEDDEISSTSLHHTLGNKNIRHYKKDSRYLLDLYTLTFEEGQTLEKMKTTNYLNRFENSHPHHHHRNGGPGDHNINYNLGSSASSSGPVSLQVDPRQNFHISSLPLLETNLHKILARKIHDFEDISFQKTKLLTKAYYQLLRDLNENDNVPKNLIPSSLPTTGNPAAKKTLSHDIRIPWQTLIGSDSKELKRIVNGLTNSAQALNEYLMELLIERDDLTAKQDSMLGEIGEMTDDLL